MNYYNEPSDILLSAVRQSSVSVFGTVAFIGEVSVKPGFAVGAVEEALTLVNDNLTEFVTSPTFETDMLTVFGAEADVELGRTIIDALRLGEELPQINVVPAEQMNGANGGFDSLTGEVYLADSLVARETSPVITSETSPVITSETPPVIASETSPVITSETPPVIASETSPVIASETSPVIASETKQSPHLADILTPVIASETKQSPNLADILTPVIASETKQSPNLADVLTEELGHYIDFKLNRIDTPGDEGELFAAFVRGEMLSEEDLGRLQGEDDTVEILDGEVKVEANQEVSFSKAANYKVGDSPLSVAVGDFNSDGISDLAVTNRYDESVSVLLGNGNGSFSNATNFAVGGWPNSVAVGEFNGDGISDLAVANYRGHNISVLLGKGNGSFSNATNFKAGDDPHSVAVEDFNGDGISDLAVANYYDNVSVLLGKGNGSFSNATNFAVGYFPGLVAVEDFNGDGISDLAVANWYDDNVSVLLGSGNGSFSNATNFAVGYFPGSVAVGDFNSDGISDLAVANSYDDNISVLLGKGNGSFSNATNFKAGDYPHSVAVEDFNGDGISDLAVANRWSDNVSVLLGNGNGSFSNATNFAVGDSPRSVAVEDFNGDGISDLAVANSYDDNISILLNTTPVTITPPNLTINNTTTREGDTNKTTNFQVTLDTPTNQTVTVNYTTANQTAIANQDYKPTQGILTFKPGETTKNITVPILGDNKVEPKETFQLKLSNPTNAQLKDQLGIATITNDDKPQPQISLGDTKIVEGNRGRKNAKFNVTLDAKPDETVRVNYATANQTAIANQDYKPTKGILTFKPGQTRKTITVPILGDSKIEPNETFQLKLSNPKNAQLKDQLGIGTITNDDKPQPQISLGDTKIVEGNRGRKNAKFQVTLNAKPDETVRVNYATADKTAIANQDYKLTKGILTFKPGQTRKTITVPILGDNKVEPNETFNLNLSKPRNANLKDRRGIGTIRDNDFAQLSIKNTQITEGDNGKKQAKFTVALNQKINERVQVNYATSDGTAKQGSDYQKTQGQLTLKPNQQKQAITVPILGDTLDEDSEKFSVTLSKPSKNVKLGDKRAIGTIKDNDEGGDKLGDSFQAAIDLGKLTEEQVIADEIGYTEVGDRDTNDFYRFQTDKKGTFVLDLDELFKDANVDLYRSGQELINQSKNGDAKRERIVAMLDPGTYYVHVYPQGSDRTPYRLSIDLL